MAAEPEMVRLDGLQWEVVVLQCCARREDIRRPARTVESSIPLWMLGISSTFV